MTARRRGGPGPAIVGLVFGFLFKDGVGVWPGQLREGRALLTISVVSGWVYCGLGSKFPGW